MLTAKQHATYEFIKTYIAQHKFAPTEAEIAAGIGIKSRGVVHRYVTAIAKEGLVNLIPHRRRNIELVEKMEKQFSLPLVGKIAAGQPIEAIYDNQTVDFSDSILGKDRYVLQVHGDSMIGDNICHGDFIICEPCQVADETSILVALIDQEEATLKRIRRVANDAVELVPSNPSMNPVRYDSNRVKIQGRYIGLLRLNS